MRRAVVAGFALVVGLLPLSAPAQEGDGPGDALLLIMDSSGSMNEPDDTGVPLIDGAKQALRVLVSALPEGAQVGLRVYGHRVPNTDRANGCLDTELVIPVGPIDPGAMRSAIDSYEARGFTPIGLSLREAAEDLGGAGTIVLVSDGLDTCAPPDPCDVAADLVEQGFGLTVHTVGLFLDDPAAERQLQCIAESTGGSFTRADSIVDLVRGLTGLATTVVGEEGGFDVPVVVGALEMLEAPVLDTVAWEFDERYFFATATGTIATGETRWYAVDLRGAQPPSHLMATAHLDDWQLEPGSEDYLEIRIFDSEGMEVGMPYEVLGVPVFAPQRTYLSEGTRWVDFGDPVPAQSVTDPYGAFPAWEPPGDDAGITGMRDRFHDAGINGGMFDLFKMDAAPPALEPGLYFAGITWSGEAAGVSRLQVGFDTYPPAPPVGDRDRPAGTVILGPGESPLLEIPGDSGQPLLGGEVPLRSIEVWMPLSPGETSSFSFEADRGEVLEMGTASLVAPWDDHAGDFRVAVARDDGAPNHRLDIGEGGRDPRIGGFEQPIGWRLLEGTHTVSVTAPPGDGDEEPAMRLSMFLFAPDPEPEPPGEAAESTPAPDAEAADPDEGGSSSPVVPIAIGAGAVLVAAGGAWWLRRRRRG